MLMWYDSWLWWHRPLSLLWSTCSHPGWVSHSRSCRRCSASCEISLVHAAENCMECMAFGCLIAYANDGWVTLGKCKSFCFTYTIVSFKEKRRKHATSKCMFRESFTPFPAELFFFVFITASSTESKAEFNWFEFIEHQRQASCLWFQKNSYEHKIHFALKNKGHGAKFRKPNLNN